MPPVKTGGVFCVLLKTVGEKADFSPVIYNKYVAFYLAK